MTRQFSAPDGISSQAVPHLTNLKAENEARILTGYPSDV
jgi:stage V sporulation protein SpoVS